ncbi:hypothetical protein V8C42DRAFT_322420 [Trichoderma barbatum]
MKRRLMFFLLLYFYFALLLSKPSITSLDYQSALQAMPPTPTPLSGCPLRRLEIRDGSTCGVYDALQLESSLTATLEARRSLTGDKNDLVLQSHLGLKHVLSIQLTGLITSSGDTVEIVTVDRPSQQMCIQIQRRKQTILFTFQETRDFNVVIYTLKKFGFRIKESISLSSHASATSLARSQSYPVASTNDFGPRLSSITPLLRQGSLQAQSPFSFTSMLNSEVPLAEMQPTVTQEQLAHPASLQGSSQQSVPQLTQASNPYQLYISHQSNTHQPRVSSPLRNAVEVHSRDTSPHSFISSSQSSFSHTEDTRSLLSHRVISEPDMLSQPRQISGYTGTNAYGSPDCQLTPPRSQETATPLDIDTRAIDGIDASSRLPLAQDFRELMPQTRKLPFVKDSKTKASRSKLEQKRADTEYRQSISNSDKLIGEIVPLGLEMDSPGVSQVNLRPTSSGSIDGQAEVFPTCHFSYEVDELPPMLITDNVLLEKINQATSKLLDQFNADIGRGCDSIACTYYYLEQIDTVRRDFWLNQLKQPNCM